MNVSEEIVPAFQQHPKTMRYGFVMTPQNLNTHASLSTYIRISPSLRSPSFHHSVYVPSCCLSSGGREDEMVLLRGRCELTYTKTRKSLAKHLHKHGISTTYLQLYKSKIIIVNGQTTIRSTQPSPRTEMANWLLDWRVLQVTTYDGIKFFHRVIPFGEYRRAT